MYIAIDQFGTIYYNLKHPRKDLMERIGNHHASKMFVDKKNGKAVHIGYVIGSFWLTLYSRAEK